MESRSLRKDLLSCSNWCFSECFQLKHYRNLLGPKYDLTMRQLIRGRPKLSPVSDSICSNLKNDAF